MLRLHKTLRNTFSFYSDEILALALQRSWWTTLCRLSATASPYLEAVLLSATWGRLIAMLRRVAWTRQLKTSVKNLGILNSVSWFFRAMAMMSAVLGDVVP